uniref:Uncharacterized protein n=1 Tax=viral metagenome TaxID=1070528 RepID=A0A6C0LMX2_9ZZZZ
MTEIKLVNSKFNYIDDLFKQHNWTRIENTEEFVTYNKEGSETEYFKCNIFNDKIIKVTVPLKNWPFHFTTRFANIDDALCFMESRFAEFLLQP